MGQLGKQFIIIKTQFQTDIQYSMQESRYKKSLPNCQICKKIYDMYYHIPRVLPKCGHTFCQKCIKEKLVNKKGRLTFTCPQCECDAIIRKSVADQLPKNITIAQLVKDGKHKNIQQDSETQSQSQTTCPLHYKKLQMVCIGCGNVKICSHCAIFGDHKGHDIGNQAGATNEDLQQLKQVLNLVEDTVNKIVLPNSPMNLQIQAKSKLVTGLQLYIKQNFKAYMAEITRRQTEILQQCDNITLDQKAGEYIDNILTSFDILRLKGSGLGKGVSRSHVEQVIQSAIQLHSQIEKIKQSFNKSVETFLEQAKKTLRQTVFFDINLLERRTLKSILKVPMSPEAKGKDKQKGRELTQMKKQQQGKKSQIRQVNDRKNKDIFLVDKTENKNKIVNASNPINSSTIKNEKVARSYATEKHSEYQQIQNINKPDIPNRKNYSSMIQKDENPSSVPPISTTKNVKTGSSVRKLTQTLKSPPKNNRSRSKSPINLIDEPDLKFYKPTKQLNYQLRPKFQTICDQIDRQPPQGTLELIGLQICDQLIAYICDYLRSKKLKFSMIKLVKNNITDEGFKILLGYLTSDTFTKVLNVTSNHLTYKSLGMIINFVTQNNILKTIYLSNNKISPIQLKKIQGSLQNKFVQVVL